MRKYLPLIKQGEALHTKAYLNALSIEGREGIEKALAADRLAVSEPKSGLSLTVTEDISCILIEDKVVAQERH